MRLIFLTLLFVWVSCSGQELDTLIYIDVAEHQSAIASKDVTIDSLQGLLDLCREFADIDVLSVVADTFEVTIIDDRVRVNVKKQGHKVWYNFEDGTKRINADYVGYRSSVLLMDSIMDSTYTVGSLYVR